MSGVQIFGTKSSQATRAAERFFRERRIPIHFVDLKKKPMAPGEIGRFVQKFGLPALLDTEGKSWIDAGLKYMKVTDAEMMARIEKDAGLLRLPLVRAGSQLALGQDEAGWKKMISEPAK